MKTTLRFEGGQELAETLLTLSERAGKRVSGEALKAGAEPIRAAAAGAAPRRAPKPDLADHIVVTTQRVRADETAAAAVGPAKGFDYGLPQEIGTAFHPAQPFMRPAFDAKVRAALEVIRAAYWTALSAVGVSRSVSAPSRPSGPEGGGGLV